MLGYCDLDKIPAPCDPYMTQEAGCVCRDSEGFLLDARGNRVASVATAPPTPVVGMPGLDSKTIGVALAALVVVLLVRR